MSGTARVFILCFCTFVTALVSYGQLDPVGSQVDLYFPQLADGGAASGKWQTAITFLNPNSSATANVSLYLYADSGSPLALDFGSGSNTTFSYSIPPGGTITIRSTATSPNVTDGWAVASANLPLQGTVQFRQIVNGVPQQEVSALATPLGVAYTSPANDYTGIALGNVYSSPLSFLVNLFDTSGNQAASGTVSVPPQGHTSFNVYSLFPSLPKTFTGSVRITPSTANSYFAAWTLSVDPVSGVFSSYPPGAEAWPGNPVDAIRNAYFKDLAAAQTLSNSANLGLQFTPQTVPLNILGDQILNAFASRADNSVNIEAALAELVSDSPSELAFAVAHEMGHTIQFRTGVQYWVPSNIEYDADQWGMVISLLAGFDPYAAAGALSKLAMATNDAGLVSQQFDNISGDLHGSFDNRVALVYANLQQLCATASLTQFCSLYKSKFHPNFPGSTPLDVRLPATGGTTSGRH